MSETAKMLEANATYAESFSQGEQPMPRPAPSPRWCAWMPAFTLLPCSASISATLT